MNAHESAGPLVSVVVPAYNAAPHLRECLDSVLAQDYPNWDCTVVDNCSTDGTGELAEEYATRDPRIRVLHNHRFLEALANHNIAARQISKACKYCKFVFADDWLFSTCLIRMVELAERYPSVAIVGAYGLRGDKVAWDGLPYTSAVISGRDVCRLKLLRGVYPFGNATSVMYRADIVRARDPLFNESNPHADKELCFDVLKHHDFGFVHQVLTFTRLRRRSLRSVSQQFNTYLPGILADLVNYGPFYLTEDELRECLSRHLDEYYAYLREAFFERRGEEFWTLHRNKMRECGFPLSYGKLARLTALKILDMAFNPKRTLEGACRRVWRLRPSNLPPTDRAATR